MHVVLLCATNRGFRVAEKLFAIGEGHDFTVFSFRETAWEPPFLADIQSLTQANSHRFVEARNVARRDLKNFWLQHPADLMLMVNWRYIVPAEVYSLARCGSYVFHDSLLPKYRGFSPTVWALINGERETGVTLFRAAEDYDAGDIVEQVRVPIGQSDTIATVVEAVTLAYLNVIERRFDQLLAGNVNCFPQNHAEATYTCKWTPADARIDWNKGSREIYNLIRATTRPYPGAYTCLEGRKLVIWSADIDINARRYVSHAPGRVVESHSNGAVTVLTGDGSIQLRTVQLEEELAVDAASMLKPPSTTLGK